MRTIPVVVAVALSWLGIVANTARADFVLHDEEHLDVTTAHAGGTLYDYSTADVLAGGHIGTADVYNYARLRVMTPGYVVTELNTYNNGTADVLAGGSVSTACVYDSSGLRVMADGSVVAELYTYNDGTTSVMAGDVYEGYAANTSRVNLSGGGIFDLDLFDDSRLTMSGGSIPMQLIAHGSSSIGMCGGSVWSMTTADTSSAIVCGGTVSLLYVGGDSSMGICGGIFPLVSTSGNATTAILGGNVQQLDAYDASYVALRGYDFEATAGLSLDGDRVVGSGVLSGHWWGGGDWIMSIDQGPDTAIWAIATPPHPGDANFDDMVSVNDLGIMALNWGRIGRTWCHADFTGDGLVDVCDLGILAFNWGWQGSGEMLAFPMPEPAILTLLCTGGLLLRRRRR